MGNRNQYSPEARQSAVRLVLNQQGQHSSQWATIKAIAPKIGCTPETLRTWVRHSERDLGQRPATTTDEQRQLKEPQRENRELKQANEILRKASAFFAQAQLDRRPK